MIPKTLQTAHAKLGLGAAQFGLDYGITGPRSRPPELEAVDILQLAARTRVPLLDASVASGHAENVLGSALPRLNPFNMVLRTPRCDRGPDFVEDNLRRSMARLKVDQAYAILVQSAGDLFGPHGQALWDRLRRLREEGLTRKIGLAAYASDDPLGLARRFKPDIVQAPASLLDQRLVLDGSLGQLADMGVEVHLRSIFLQGILFMPPHQMPAHLQGSSRSLSRVRRMIAEGRSDPLQAALGWALARREASCVVVSVTTAAELQAILAAAASPCPELDWDGMAIDDPAALEADRWVAA